MCPGEGLRQVVCRVGAKVGKAAVVLFSSLDDGVAEFVPENERAVGKGRGYDSGATSFEYSERWTQRWNRRVVSSESCVGEFSGKSLHSASNGKDGENHLHSKGRSLYIQMVKTIIL